MPTLVRAVTDERDALLAFLDEQRAAVRRAVRGLTDEQARSRPGTSELTLAWLVDHLARIEHHWIAELVAGESALPASDWEGQPGEPLETLLDRYAAVAARTEEVVGALPDLEALVALPEAPWFPPGAKRSVRWILLHLVEEAARHAGHADIVRESLDGAVSYALIAAEREGGTER